MSGMIKPGTPLAASLVLGADGAAGAGVVAALIEAGSPVVAVGAPGEMMDALAQAHGEEPGLHLLRQPLPLDEAAAAALAEQVRAHGVRLHAVFAHLFAPSTSGRLLDQPAARLEQRLSHDVVAHLALARHLLPLLQDQDGTRHYVILGGPATECGWAGHGHASVGSAALHMLAKVLHEEAVPLGVRVQLLAVAHPLSTPKNRAHACAGWPDALSVGRRAVELLRPAASGRVRAVVPFDAAWVPPPVRTLFDALPSAPTVSSLDLNRG
ncbi:SDR family oxidoreductase [Pseudoxanthomonas sp. UC19_8]|uniref:SDR family oxidoreductase n=1 Tax=Pseudoxanthomonas sp. UC19_8 TaxID=3350175 RepID=UPI0036D2D440